MEIIRAIKGTNGRQRVLTSWYCSGERMSPILEGSFLLTSTFVRPYHSEQQQVHAAQWQVAGSCL